MAYTLKRLLVGKAKKTAQAMHERLTKKTGLAVFASDALSSTAYATEEILLVLAVAYAFGGRNAFNYVVPITFAIVIVLVIVAISYRQTIFAYPSGGGAYIVAKDNLGTMPGLVAGGALLVDYVLTVSVSISAGVAAITSAAQGTRLAWVEDHKVFSVPGADRAHRAREFTRRTRIRRALCRANLFVRDQFPLHDWLRTDPLLPESRHSCACAGGFEAGGRL